MKQRFADRSVFDLTEIWRNDRSGRFGKDSGPIWSTTDRYISVVFKYYFGLNFLWLLIIESIYVLTHSGGFGRLASDWPGQLRKSKLSKKRAACKDSCRWNQVSSPLSSGSASRSMSSYSPRYPIRLMDTTHGCSPQKTQGLIDDAMSSWTLQDNDGKSVGVNPGEDIVTERDRDCSVRG